MIYFISKQTDILVDAPIVISLHFDMIILISSLTVLFNILKHLHTTRPWLRKFKHWSLYKVYFYENQVVNKHIVLLFKLHTEHSLHKWTNDNKKLRANELFLKP